MYAIMDKVWTALLCAGITTFTQLDYPGDRVQRAVKHSITMTKGSVLLASFHQRRQRFRAMGVLSYLDPSHICRRAVSQSFIKSFIISLSSSNHMKSLGQLPFQQLLHIFLVSYTTAEAWTLQNQNTLGVVVTFILLFFKISNV